MLGLNDLDKFYHSEKLQSTKTNRRNRRKA